MSPPAAPYYGYYEVDLFDCPPFEMFSNGDDPRAIDIRDYKLFEPHSMKLWCHLARTATGIVDIGAHVGVYSLAAAALRPDIPIYAFEPNFHACARLRVNKMKNRFTNIRDANIAIGQKSKVTEFFWPVKDNAAIASGGSITPREGDNVERALVLMMPLDEIPGARDVGERGLVKIDVEGAEHFVFGGMQKTIANHRPDIIVETFNKIGAEVINQITQPLGYHAFGIDESGCLLPQDQILKADPKNTARYNQFLTVHSPPTFL